jgi:hypothetical protein
MFRLFLLALPLSHPIPFKCPSFRLERSAMEKSLQQLKTLKDFSTSVEMTRQLKRLISRKFFESFARSLSFWPRLHYNSLQMPVISTGAQRNGEIFAAN